MPRTKATPKAPSSSLDGFSIAFPDSKKASIPLHHTSLANKTFTQLEEEIEEAGGTVVTKIEAGTTHLVATIEQFQKSGARVKSAIQQNIQIVSYDWLVDSLESDGAVDEANYSLQQSPTATTPASNSVRKTNGKSKKRARDDDDDDKADVKKVKAEDDKTTNGSKPSSKPKARVPVDEKYPEQQCRVYQDDDGVCLDARLNQTQSGQNANKFYKVQVLEHTNGMYYTWTRWGRVGENGQNKVLGDGTLQNAVKEFEKKFRDKSGNTWIRRDDPPNPGKYVLLEISYGESDGEDDELPGAGSRRDSKDTLISSASSEIESKLPKPVADLMSLIFNNDFFSSTLADLEYDATKMPLGKLSKKTLLQGYEVLKDLSTLIGSGGPGDAETIIERSNTYYSLIPHAFGRNRPPVLSHMDMIKREVTLLENLTDMQLANEIMKTAKVDKKKQEEKMAMVDRQYEGLGMQEMTPLERKSVEFKELQDYLVKSAGKSHGIRYQVQDIFRIERHGEGDRYKGSKFAKLAENKTDRRLLWHGSRTTNYGGILSQGLRIAPPEAPVSGKFEQLPNAGTKH